MSIVVSQASLNMYQALLRHLFELELCERSLQNIWRVCQSTRPLFKCGPLASMLAQTVVSVREVLGETCIQTHDVRTCHLLNCIGLPFSLCGTAVKYALQCREHIWSCKGALHLHCRVLQEERVPQMPTCPHTERERGSVEARDFCMDGSACRLIGHGCMHAGDRRRR